jgi:hypothetical protein
MRNVIAAHQEEIKIAAGTVADVALYRSLRRVYAADLISQSNPYVPAPTLQAPEEPLPQ